MTDENITMTIDEYAKLVGVKAYIGDMREMRKAGATLQKIADKYGVTRERVRQLLAETNESTTNSKDKQEA